ncbi:MAG TPA: hypothetical protein VD905_21860 [Flavobacteriales bacterium]|nr:hypothetical protein [Flavobacteriales bacterium]
MLETRFPAERRVELKAEIQKREITLSPAQVLMIRLYRRYKQIAKRIDERIEKAKSDILAIAPEEEWTGLDGEKKVVSVSFQSRTGFDLENFTRDYPELAREYTSKGIPFPVVRLH